MLYRKQTTVMFTDIVGFTSIMEKSESKAMSFIQNNMLLIKESLLIHDGKLIKELGDGSLCIFDSPVNAISSALNIQNALHDAEYQIRIGIHSGSVLFEENDIFGDTVNVASRLQSKAPVGGILVSEEVLATCPKDYNQKTITLGLTKLKGLGRLLNIHYIKTMNTELPTKKNKEKPSIPKSLIISIFPFQNNGNPEDSYFAFGIHSDLVDNLKKSNSISVVPVTSLMKAVRNGNTQENAAKLFNSSILITGTVTHDNDIIQISVTLKNLASNQIIWNDSWKDNINDLPLIRGKLSDSILKALGKNPFDFPDITKIEVQSASVYAKYLRTLHIWNKIKSEEDLLLIRSIIKEVIKNEPHMIPAIILLAATYRDTGDFKTSLEILDTAYKKALSHENNTELFSVFQAKGVCYWAKGDLDKALHNYTKAMHFAVINGNKTDECSILNNIGLIDSNKLDFSSARTKLQKSLDIATELGSKPGQAHTLCNLGLTYWKQGNPEKAYKYYQKSLKFVTEIQDKAGEMNLLINMGIIQSYKKNTEKALQLASKALKIAEHLNNKRGICFSLTNIGNYFLILGLNEEALQNFTRAIDIAKKIGLKTSEELLLSNIAIYYLHSDKESKAVSTLVKSLQMAKELNDTEGIIENQKYLAHIYIKQNKLTKAQKLLEGCLELSENYNLKNEIGYLQSSLAFCMAKSQTPINKVLKSLDIAKNKCKNNRDTIEICNNIANCYKALSAYQNCTDKKMDSFKEKAKQWQEKTKQSILDFSKNIKSEQLKHSFLTNIPLHREILENHPSSNK